MLVWLNLHVRRKGIHAVRRGISLSLGVVIVLTLSAAAWFWRQKTGDVEVAGEKSPRLIAGTSTPPSGSSSRQKAVTSAPVPVSAGRASRALAVIIPTPSGIAPGTNAAGFLARAPQNVFETQLALARQGISPGSLDGVFGSKTRLAVMAFQQKENLPITGEADALTKSRLLLATPPFTNYTITGDDLARLRPLGKTWLEKSRQDRLEYETILELLSEKSESHPNLIQRLNPAIAWTNLVAGTTALIPNVERPPVHEKAAFARIHLESRLLQVFDEGANLVGHFPCSIASFAEKRPAGELRVVVIVSNPNYTFDPDNFPESPEARQLNRKLILPAGPNNPVGSVWIGLDKPGYGIHGTPRPEQVGRAESHGCFRLANWNVEYFSQLAWIGMPVYVEP